MKSDVRVWRFVLLLLILAVTGSACSSSSVRSSAQPTTLQVASAESACGDTKANWVLNVTGETTPIARGMYVVVQWMPGLFADAALTAEDNPWQEIPERIVIDGTGEGSVSVEIPQTRAGVVWGASPEVAVRLRATVDGKPIYSEPVQGSPGVPCTYS